MKNRLLRVIIFLCIAGCVVFLTFNRHSRSGICNYHSVIWSDKAGYYVYLPAAFKYRFDPAAFPDSIDSKTGKGFFLDRQHHKVITQFTYGVALMQMPFYLVADVMAKHAGFRPDGFSLIYHRAINVAAVFYLLFGLFFLGRYLSASHRRPVVILVLLSLFLATNLYYYSVDETGMSHVYSFFLFSCFLYLLRRTSHLREGNIPLILAFGMVSALIVLIRPTNLLFLTSFFFIGIQSGSDIIARAKNLVKPATIAVLIAGAFIILLPQFIYWKITFGSYIAYSYSSQGFDFARPKLAEVLFSPNNGLFPYTPFMILMIIAAIMMAKKKNATGIFALSLFVVLSYLFSCWWDCSFGCSFGARSYVEYMALFSIPVACLYERIAKLNTVRIALFALIVAAFAVINLVMTYQYDGCFYGGTWDWKAFLHLFVSSFS